MKEKWGETSCVWPTKEGSPIQRSWLDVENWTMVSSGVDSVQCPVFSALFIEGNFPSVRPW